jgi:hypothetical protein
MPPIGLDGGGWELGRGFGGEKRSWRILLLMVNFLTLPVLANFAPGLAEKAPGARMLSSVLKLRRRLLVDMLLLRVRPKVLPPPSILPPKVPGVLAVLDALPGLP